VRAIGRASAYPGFLEPGKAMTTLVVTIWPKWK
jgi:hypothetical protein